MRCCVRLAVGRGCSTRGPRRDGQTLRARGCGLWAGAFVRRRRLQRCVPPVTQCVLPMYYMYCTQVTYNTLVDVMGKMGQWAEALRLLDRMAEEVRSL